jgi:antitoxin MazE
VLRKVFRSGNSLVISLPREAVELFGLAQGSEISIELDREQRRLVLTPAHQKPLGIDPEFARQINAFIERYRPALEALAK